VNDRKIVYNGRIIRLETGAVTLPNGASLEMEVVRHPGGAAVVALDGQRRVCLLHQYRPVLDDWLWELPAGKIDHGETPLDTARRELQEEAGIRAEDWLSLGGIVSSPGIFDEVISLYLARELSEDAAVSEAHEVFEVHWLPFDAALQRARDGDITDAKTIAGLFRTAGRL